MILLRHWSVVEIRYVLCLCRASDLSLERTLALNHSFETYVVTRQSVARSLRFVNNTHVIHSTIVANDPADFSRNSFVQRTLNDLLAEQGHSTTSIDLLRLVGTDSDVVSMSDLVHFLVADGVLKHVQQLHLTVYIGLWFYLRTYLRCFCCICHWIVPGHEESRELSCSMNL